MLVIYDDNGKVIFMGNNQLSPEGDLHSLTIVQPKDKYLDKIDTSTNPHTPVFKEYPKSDMDILKEENSQQQADIDYLLLILG